MVLVGKSKFDKNGRVSLIKDIADLMDLMDGDYIEYYIEDGQVVIRKMTKLYQNNFDLEGEDIEKRLRNYEEEHLGDIPEEAIDEETALQLAREQYEKDKKARAAQRKQEEGKK